MSAKLQEVDYLVGATDPGAAEVARLLEEAWTEPAGVGGQL